MANVIFNRPIRLGKVVYPKSKRSVEVDDKLLVGKFVDAKIKEGAIVIPAAPAAKAASKKADAAPAAKADSK